MGIDFLLAFFSVSQTILGYIPHYPYMTKQSSHIAYAVLATVVACSIVFAIALYVFGSGGMSTPLSPRIDVTPTIVKSGSISISLPPSSTGSS